MSLRQISSLIRPPKYLQESPSTMSSPQREQYQLPDQRGSQQTSYAGGAYGSAVETSAGPQVNYICGECNAKVTLGRGDAIRCKDCGHRVLYKERTKRSVAIRHMRMTESGTDLQAEWCSSRQDEKWTWAQWRCFSLDYRYPAKQRRSGPQPPKEGHELI